MPAPLDLESLFAAIGLDRMLAGNAALHKYELERAAGLPKEIRRRMMTFMATAGFKPAADMGEFDYDKALDLVTAGKDAQTQRHRALLAAVPDPELAQDLGIQLDRVVGWANGILPREYQAPVAQEVRMQRPDEHSIADFRRQWDVARDPMVIMSDLEDGSLADDQVGAMNLLYPEIARDFRQAVTDTLTSIRARKGIDWDPAPMKASLLGILQGQDATDPELTAAVQQTYAAKDAEQMQPRPPRPPSKSQAQPEATPGQKASGGAPGAA